MEFDLNTLSENVQDLLFKFILYEREILHGLAIIMILIGMIVYIILLYVPATYGRYSNTERFYSLAIPARIAWFLQEIPAFLIPVALILLTQLTKFGYLFGQTYTTTQLLVLSCFVVHYFQRSFVYSLSIVGGKPTPLYAFMMAAIFCSVNGYMQARGVLLLSKFPDNTLTLCRTVIGVMLFFCGMLINIHSDYTLRNLRKPGEKGYKIPYGGFFNFISSANFFGEILEWCGFAIASWSSVSFAFSFFTAANLIPRAVSHHKWYLQKFDDYPKDRKMIIPYIL